MTEIFILLGLMVANGLFVMTEIALVSARKSRLEQLANKGNINAKTALELSTNPEIFLSTAQIFITLIAILTGLYSGDKFSGYLEPFLAKIGFLKNYAATLSVVIVVFVVTFLSIIIGELVPKKIGLLKPESIAIASAQPMKFLSKLSFPLVFILNKLTKIIFNIFRIKQSKDNVVTEDEIKALVNESAESGEINTAEQQIIERVFHLGDRNITSLMTHRSDIVWVDIDAKIEDLHAKIKPTAHSIYPICDKQIDELLGIVQIKDLLLADKKSPLRNFVKPALFVPENNSAYQLMEKFKQSKVHSAFIVDEYGTLQGMITLNNILEAIVGDIPEVDEDEYEMVQRHDGSYLVDGQYSFYDFLSKFDKEQWMSDEQEYDTVAGFMIHHLEHIPAVSEVFEWRGFNFEIMDMDGARIDKILVTKKEDLKEKVED